MMIMRSANPVEGHWSLSLHHLFALDKHLQSLWMIIMKIIVIIMVMMMLKIMMMTKIKTSLNNTVAKKRPLLLRNSQNLIKIAPKFNFHFTVEIVNMDNWKCLFKPGMLPLQNQSVESAWHSTVILSQVEWYPFVKNVTNLPRFFFIKNEACLNIPSQGLFPYGLRLSSLGHQRLGSLCYNDHIAGDEISLCNERFHLLGPATEIRKCLKRSGIRSHANQIVIVPPQR